MSPGVLAYDKNKKKIYLRAFNYFSSARGALKALVQRFTALQYKTKEAIC